MATKRSKTTRSTRSTKFNEQDHLNVETRNQSRNNKRDDRQNSNEQTPRAKSVYIIPRSKNQETLVDHLFDESVDIVAVTGAAGTGKSFLMTKYAVKQLQEGKVERIVVTRPAVSVDEQHGFLPGSLVEKMAPWTRPIMDIFMEHYSKQELEKMLANETIEIAPLAYMRGRAEPLTSLIPTPDGFKPMGDLKVGDEIFGSEGRTTKVTGVFPQGKKAMTTLFFEDGSHVKTSEDHLWNVTTDKGQTYTTLPVTEIIELMKTKEVAIPNLIAPIDSYKTFSINPLHLGMFLAGGDVINGKLSITGDDTHVHPDVITYDSGDTFTLHDDALLKFVLDNDLHITKKLPVDMVFANTMFKVQLIKGYTGTETSTNSIDFYHQNMVVLEDVKLLLESCGFVATIGNNTIRTNLNVCRKITTILPHLDKEECQCISVEADDKLYLTNNFIVTHNTFKNCVILADEFQNATINQGVMMLTRIGEGSKLLITGDLKQHDRGYGENGLKSLVERMETRESNRIKVVRFDTQDVQRHPVVTEVLDIYSDLDIDL